MSRRGLCNTITMMMQVLRRITHQLLKVVKVSLLAMFAPLCDAYLCALFRACSFEQKGYKLVAMKFLKPTSAQAAEHYADLSKKPFFPGLVAFFSSG